MLTMETDDSGVVLIKASGRLSKADYDRFVPEFERIAGGRVAKLVEIGQRRNRRAWLLRSGGEVKVAG
ncbi:MAG: hypothetical protein ACREJ5_00395 [Geminicoccaceae bacterium]